MRGRGRQCSSGRACADVVLTANDFHRRSRKSNVRSSRCKYCAALAQREVRGTASEHTGHIGERYDWRRRKVVAGKGNTRRPARLQRDEEWFAVKLPS